MLIYLSLVVAIVGLLFYILASNAKIAELGRIAFGSGLLSYLLMHGMKMIGHQ